MRGPIWQGPQPNRSKPTESSERVEPLRAGCLGALRESNDPDGDKRPQARWFPVPWHATMQETAVCASR